MATLTITLSPSAVNSINARWCVVGQTGWKASGVAVTLSPGTYTIEYRQVPGYTAPASESLVFSDTQALTRTYADEVWPAAWGCPTAVCHFRGQVFAGVGAKLRWSEIGHLAFLGATAKAEKNEAGEYILSTTPDDTIQRVFPMRHGVLMFSNHTVKFFHPVQQPAPTYGVKDMQVLGIKNPLAVDGTDKEIAFVTTEGVLMKVNFDQYENPVFKKLDFREFLAPMQENFDITTGEGVISVVYNPVEDEFYICNKTRGFVLKDDKLTELGYLVSGIADGRTLVTSQWHNTQVVGAFRQTSVVDYMYLEFEPMILAGNSIKTVTGLEIGASLPEKTIIECMVKWRNNKTSKFNSTPWKRCSPEGFCSPQVSGVELALCLRFRPYIGVDLSSITVEWQLSDKRFVRGDYTNAGSDSSNAG